MANPNTPVFPGALPDDQTLMVSTNDAFTTLAFGITNSQTSGIQVNQAFNTPCLVRIDSEILFIGSNTGNVYNAVVRGVDGTTAVTHASNAQVFGLVEADYHNQLSVEVQAIAAALGINLANVVQTTTAFGGDVSGTYGAIIVTQVGGATSSQIAYVVTNFAVTRNEIPTGVINGSNVAYTLTHTPLVGSTMLWKNGTLLKATTDFTVSGTTITMSVAPSGADWLYVLYRSTT